MILGSLIFQTSVTGTQQGVNQLNQVSTSFNNAKGAADRAQTATVSLGGALRALAGAQGIRITTRAFKDLVEVASDAAETAQAFGTQFSSNIDAANQSVSELSSNFGISTREAQDYLVSIGAIASGAGLAADESLRFGQSITQLGLDLASSRNQDATESIRALTSAITTGEAESVKQRFGILLGAEALREYAEANGIVFDSLSRAEVIQLRYNSAVEQAGVAVGDVARSSGTVVDSQRRLNSAIDELQVSLGTIFLPVVAEVAQILTRLVQAFTSLPAGIRNVLGVVALFTPAIVGLGVALKALLPVLGALAVNPFVLAVAGVVALTAGIVALNNVAVKAAENLRDVTAAGQENDIALVLARAVDEGQNLEVVLENLARTYGKSADELREITAILGGDYQRELDGVIRRSEEHLNQLGAINNSIEDLAGGAAKDFNREVEGFATSIALARGEGDTLNERAKEIAETYNLSTQSVVDAVKNTREWSRLSNEVKSNAADTLSSIRDTATSEEDILETVALRNELERALGTQNTDEYERALARANALLAERAAAAEEACEAEEELNECERRAAEERQKRIDGQIDSISQVTSAISAGLTFLGTLSADIGDIVAESYEQALRSTEDYYDNLISMAKETSEEQASLLAERNEMENEADIERLANGQLTEEQFAQNKANRLAEEMALEEQQAAELIAVEREAAVARYQIELEQFEAAKAFKIAAVIIEGALGAVSALVQGITQLGVIAGSIVGGIAAVAIATTTAFSVDQISRQQAPPPPSFAAGGLITRQIDGATIGEAGAEAVIPLTDPRTLETLRNALGTGQGGSPINLSVSLGNQMLYKGIQDGIRDGKILVNKRSIA